MYLQVNPNLIVYGEISLYGRKSTETPTVGCETQFPSRRCSSMWVGSVVVGRVVGWVAWIADCLVQLAARAPKP